MTRLSVAQEVDSEDTSIVVKEPSQQGKAYWASTAKAATIIAQPRESRTISVGGQGTQLRIQSPTGRRCVRHFATRPQGSSASWSMPRKPARSRSPVSPLRAAFEPVRRAATGLPEVDESTSYGTPALKVRGKFLTRLKEDGETIVLAGWISTAGTR